MTAQDYFRVAHFENPDDHARAMPQFNQRYCQTGPGRFAGTVHQFAQSGGVNICREQSNVPLLQEGSSRSGERTFGVPLNLRRNATYQGTAMTDTIGLLSGGQDFELHSAGAADYVMVMVDDEAFAGYAEYLGGLDALQWLSQRTLHVRHAALQRASGEVGACVEEAAHDTDRLRFDNARKALRDEVMGSLLYLLVEALPPPKRDVTRLTYADVVQRSREYILSRPGEAVSVLDLCRLLRICRRTLQTSFIEVSGVSPSTYLRAVRLAAVRKLLRATPAAELGIGDAAACWGFLHCSKFAADFRAMFGMAPSQVPRP
ncbi:MAG: helix-turn-helix domain-containing protein [Cupriavidus necator]